MLARCACAVVCLRSGVPGAPSSTNLAVARLRRLEWQLPCAAACVAGCSHLHVRPRNRRRRRPHPPQDKGGVIPALQKLSYAGKNLEDAQRTLEQ